MTWAWKVRLIPASRQLLSLILLLWMTPACHFLHHTAPSCSSCPPIRQIPPIPLLASSLTRILRGGEGRNVAGDAAGKPHGVDIDEKGDVSGIQDPQPNGFNFTDATSPLRPSWGNVETKVEMHQDEALRRVKLGGSILLLGIPKETEFGINLRSWITGDKFKGIKMVPPGLHILCWSAGHGMSQCMWVKIVQGGILVRKWDESLEDIVDVGHEAEVYAHGVRRFDFDCGMAPFNAGELEAWTDLTHFVTEGVLYKAGIPIGKDGTTCHISPGDPDELAMRDATTTSVTPFWKHLARTVSYTAIEIPRTAQQSGFSSLDIKHKQLDSSCILDELLSIQYGNDTRLFLGEFQLSFVSFLLISSLSALEHWKQVIALMTGCSQAMRKRPALFRNFLMALEFQLLKAPEDWFRDELTADSFLLNALVNLYDSLDNLKHSVLPENDKRLGPLILKGQSFFKFLENRFDVKMSRPKLNLPKIANTTDDVDDDNAHMDVDRGVTRVECAGEQMVCSERESAEEEGPMVVDVEAERLAFGISESKGEEASGEDCNSSSGPIYNHRGNPRNKVEDHEKAMDSEAEVEMLEEAEQEMDAIREDSSSMVSYATQGDDDKYIQDHNDEQEDVESLERGMQYMDLETRHIRPGVIGAAARLYDQRRVHEFSHENERRNLLSDPSANAEARASLIGGMQSFNSIDDADVQSLGTVGGHQYLVSRADDGMVIDMRGETIFVSGPRHMALQHVDVRALEEKYGKKVVFADTSQILSLDPGENLLTETERAMESRATKDTSGGAALEDKRRWRERQGASISVKAEGASISVKPERNTTAEHVFVARPPALPTGEKGVDYSSFEQLTVSEEEEKPGVPMCKRCNKGRAAELAVTNMETGEEMELICQECADYFDDDGEEVKRMQWMLDEPDWWKTGNFTVRPH